MESSNLPRHQTFVRNARAAIVVWVTLSVLLSVLFLTVLLVPHWIAHGPGAFAAGHHGLYQSCVLDGGSGAKCAGSVLALSALGSGALQAATVLMVLACCLCLLSLVALPLMFFFGSWPILAFGGCLQAVVGLLLFAVLLVFPAGWDAPAVRSLCGAGSAPFRLGACRLGWAFALAVLTLLDAAAVAVLALVLASKLFQLAPSSSKLQYASRGYLVDEQDSNASNGAPPHSSNGTRRRNEQRAFSHRL